MRQVSQESYAIFDFILEVSRYCKGDWSGLASSLKILPDELRPFLEYAAVFLGNIGNYYGHGDQKFVPNVMPQILKTLSSLSPKANALYRWFQHEILARHPVSLGYPSAVAQSAYYPGDLPVSRKDLESVAKILEKHSIETENTRLQKSEVAGRVVYDVLQASVEHDPEPRELETSLQSLTRLVRGDHSGQLQVVCESLERASEYASNDKQRAFLREYVQSFRTGSTAPYRASQRIWVQDYQPSVEAVIGFIEPYRDPYGIRAEFEGLAAVVDKEATKKLTELVETAPRYIRRLPWAQGFTENDGKGPFEKDKFDNPDFTSLHTVAYCSSIIFPGINLPNYNDIRQSHGFKNIMITNSLTETVTPGTAFVSAAEEPHFLKVKPHAYYLWVAFHELLGHGTSKLLAEESPGTFNFDIKKPPVNPLTGRAIETWYGVGQTWTGLFGDIATSVDECRAECVGAYLVSDRDLVAMFGYTESSEVTADDLEYNMYLQLGAAGLRALKNYSVEDDKWGQAHSRAHFAMFKVLLACSEDFLTVNYEASKPASLPIAAIDRAQIATHARPALADLLLRLHMFRCTADVAGCRSFYEDLTKVDGVFLNWRKMVIAHRPADSVFVQANTFIDEKGDVYVKEYEASVEGMIQSWAERHV